MEKRILTHTQENQNEALSIKFENVDKVYDNGIKAIDRLNLTINNGEFCVLLGPSGCGKTTALRMIAGLESISDGYLKFNDVIMNSVAPKDRNISMVFQNYALYPFMTVYNNIAFGIKNKSRNNPSYNALKHKLKVANNSNYEKIEALKSKIAILVKGSGTEKDRLLSLERNAKAAKVAKETVEYEKLRTQINELKTKFKAVKNDPQIMAEVAKTKEEIKKLYETKTKNEAEIAKLKAEKAKLVSEWKNGIPKRIEDISNMLGINMFLRRKPAELSGGQRQRVALARAISKETNIFLYDEPLSNLDAKLRAKMRVEIRELHDKLGATSIYVTHDQIEAMSMADKIIVMHKGYIQQIGRPIDLIDRPFNLFVAKFIGNTDVNIFEAKYVSNTEFAVSSKVNLEISNRTYVKQVDWTKHKTVSLMFRPENIIVDPALVDNMKTNVFVGKIKRIELLGSSVLAEVLVKDFGTVLISIPTSFNPTVGEDFKFAINTNKIQLYEQEYGYNIGEDFSEENQTAKEVWIQGLEERTKNSLLLHAQKNKIALNEYPSLLVKSLFMKSEKERLINAKSKPVIEEEKIAK